jgi:hypothetical protein
VKDQTIKSIIEDMVMDGTHDTSGS